MIVARALTELVPAERIDLVIANGENSAAGSGITPSIYKELIKAGVDCITLGDHIYRRAEIAGTLQRESNIVRPANYPATAPGRDYAIVQSRSGISVAVISLMGRVFMNPVDCPYTAAERILAKIPNEVKIRFVDFHAEATSDKQLMGRFLDGRVSAVLGTHTHVPTADECILPKGTAFQCDVGMTGPHESILGRRIERVLEKTLTFLPTHFEVATGDVRLNGAIVDIDRTTGKATAIKRLCVREAELSATSANVKISDEH